MARSSAAMITLVTLAACLAASQALDIPGPPGACSSALRKKIKWGLATSSYQIEGAWNDDGKGKSIWDTFAQTPGNIYENQNGNVAVDHYHKFKQDVALMKQLGMKHYRLSLSWPRIIPKGSAGSPVNPAGIDFYKSLCKELRKAGIQPMITMFHWDLPQALQDKYGGFTDGSGQFVKDFKYYAEVVSRELGPYVSQVLTFNEPLSICQLGYGISLFAPGVSGQQYACGHNLLLAHAEAAKVLRSHGKKVGMALSGHWGIPFSSSPQDVAGAENFMVFQFAWMADPLYKGDYPQIMKTILGGQLPTFSAAQKKAIKGSVDFFGLNFYTSHYVRGDGPNNAPADLNGSGPNGQTPGPVSDLTWLFVDPTGIQKTLKWISKRYNRPSIYITENGVCEPGENDKPKQAALQDDFRLNYYKGYVDNVCQAAADGVKVDGYFGWSLMDNFEWREGYHTRFGLVHVDFKDPSLPRTPKASALWFSKHFFSQNKAAKKATKG